MYQLFLLLHLLFFCPRAVFSLPVFSAREILADSRFCFVTVLNTSIYLVFLNTTDSGWYLEEIEQLSSRLRPRNCVRSEVSCRMCQSSLL